MVSDKKIRQLGLGVDMRVLRKNSGLTTRGVAEEIGVSRTSVNRTEHGVRTIPADEAIALCDLFGVTGSERQALVERACRGDNDKAWLATGAAFQDQFRSLVALEQQASMFTHVSMLLVPGLLQTPDYVRAIVEDIDRNTDQVLETRIARQARLTSPDARSFRFMIDEFALRRQVGSSQVMEAQLAHLVQLSADPNISIRVIPATVGAHAGIGGSFIVLDFPDGKAHVYLESIEIGVLLTQRSELEQFIDATDELSNAVLSEEHSAELIDEIRRELFHGRVGVV